MTHLLHPCIFSIRQCSEVQLALGKRRKSVTLPILPTYLIAMTQRGEDKKLKKLKGVKFPPSVLMQQAITEGDLQEIKQLVCEHGSKIVEAREPSGLPPVMRCVFESKTHCLKLLVEAGADLTARDEENWTALHVAAAMDDLEAAAFIVKTERSLTEVRNVDGERPIDLADSVEMARMLLQADLQGFSLEQTTHQDSSETAIIRVVHEHLQKGSDCEGLNAVLKVNTAFDTLLHLAASKNYPRLAKYILAHKLIDTEFRDRRGWTPLHTAAYYNSLDMIMLLVQYGASVHSLAHSYEKASDLTEHELILAVLREEEGLDYV